MVNEEKQGKMYSKLVTMIYENKRLEGVSEDYQKNIGKN